MTKRERINHLQRGREELLINKSLPIVDLLEEKYQDKILLPKELIESKLLSFKEKFASYRSPRRHKGNLYKEYLQEYGYFTYGVLDKYLMELYDIEEGFDVNPSSVWMSRKTNNYLRQIDLQIERLYNPGFKPRKFGRYVTCNYCVPNIHFLNSDGINIDSYEDFYLYIRDDIKRKEIKSMFFRH